MLQKQYGPIKNHFKRVQKMRYGRECRPSWSVLNIRWKQLIKGWV